MLGFILAGALSGQAPHDLVVAFSATAECSHVTYRISVGNVGPGPAGPFAVWLYYDALGPPPPFLLAADEDFTVEGLDPGGELLFIHARDFGGSRLLRSWVLADPLNVTGEETRWNNGFGPVVLDLKTDLCTCDAGTVSTPCFCDGQTRDDGSCCSGVWQQAPCSSDEGEDLSSVGNVGETDLIRAGPAAEGATSDERHAGGCQACDHSRLSGAAFLAVLFAFACGVARWRQDDRRASRVGRCA